MKKKIRIEIKSCKDCPFLKEEEHKREFRATSFNQCFYEPNCTWSCKKADNKVIDNKVHSLNYTEIDIPDWCPVIEFVKESKRSRSNRADILEYYCNDCGWPIVDVVCNDEFLSFKDAANWDYWVYCTNKGCKNHDGEGVFQEFPNWVKD